MASYFRYEMGYVALPGQVEIKESGEGGGGGLECTWRLHVCTCMRNLSER